MSRGSLRTAGFAFLASIVLIGGVRPRAGAAAQHDERSLPADFNEPIRINYSRTEQVNTVAEIENNIARECLKFLNVAPSIFISTVADMPASTGMGGSSSFAVGLLINIVVALNDDIDPTAASNTASGTALASSTTNNT